MIDRYQDRFREAGTASSGDFGHAGRPGERGGSNAAVASQTAKAIRASGGITVSIHGDVPHEGFAVAGITDASGTKVESMYDREVTAKDVRSYMSAHADQLKEPNAYMGAWVDAGKTFLDVSQVFSDRSAALDAARQRDEIAVFDLAKFESVYTMSDQQRPSISKGKFTEAAQFRKKMHLIFGKDQSAEQIAKAINAARNASK